MSKSKILVVDDEPNVTAAFQIGLERLGYDVATANDGEQALQIAKEEKIDAMLLDIRMLPMDGLEVLRQTKEKMPNAVVIMVSAHSDVRAAVQAMKHGAFDYVLKPSSAEELDILIKKALQVRNLADENIYLKKQLREKHKFEDIVGNSRPMQEVFSLMETVVNTDTTVLVVGDTGTGKELVAQALHYNGPRADNRFYALHCAAIPEHLFESELFGHEKGAFTGADSRKIGAFEAVDGGTFFLDEVGETPLSIQAKLLRVLQEREIVRVGSTTPIRVDVRLIAATNRNLAEEVKAKRFREDLYYRLNVVEIRLPPLRDRKDDIPLLVKVFLQKYAGKNGPKEMSKEALEALFEHNWPGNVRELENLIERAMVLSKRDVITLADFPPMALRETSAAGAFEIDTSAKIAQGREAFEKAYMCRLLGETRGNISAAARRAGIAWQNFQRKMKKYDLNAKAFQSPR